MPLKRRAAPRAELMGWDGSAWQRILVASAKNPNIRTTIYDTTVPIEILPTGGDAKTNAYNQLVTGAWLYGFNESTWDRWRNNTEATVLASATRTASGNSADQTNYNAKGVILRLNITAVSGTAPTLDVRVQGKDVAAANYYTLAAFTQKTSTGAHILVVHPGVTDVQARLEEQDVPIPRTWRISYTIGGTNPSFTFSVAAAYIV